MDLLNTSEENIKQSTIALNKAIAIYSATASKDQGKPYYKRAVALIKNQKLWEFVTEHHTDPLAYIRLALKYDLSQPLFWIISHNQKTQRDNRKTYQDISDSWVLEMNGIPNASMLLLMNWLTKNNLHTDKNQIENIRFNLLINACHRELGGKQSKMFIKKFPYDLLIDLLSPTILDPFKMLALNIVLSPQRDFNDIVKNCKMAVQKGIEINKFVINGQEKTLFECPLFEKASSDQIQIFLQMGLSFRSDPLFVPTEAMIEAESNHQKILLNQAVGQSVKTSREKRKI